MDVSVVAAVGSFAVSERILKPKATVLVILGCILAYDLTAKTHDVSSLRVYRGPALLAFTLMCCAYSLRTWRRNGVACDELIFLPGTPHGEVHGIDEMGQPTNASSDSVPGSSSTPPPHPLEPRSEGDAAAGLGRASFRDDRLLSRRSSGLAHDSSHRGKRERISSKENGLEMNALLDQGNPSIGRVEDLDSWDEDDNDSDDPPEFYGDGDEESGGSESGTEEGCRPNMLCRNTHDESADPDADTSEDNDGQNGLERFRENHPRISRLGTFFFFRASSSGPSDNAVYAPSGPSVFGAGLDLSMPILFNFHLFIEAYNHINPEDSGSDLTAKILPLIFLSVLIVRSFIPPSRRRHFWSIAKFTAMAPFYRVSFRDAFLGDVLTSLVRPMQDISFALSYYATVIYGTVFGSYGLTDAGRILERSWFLHNVMLPACALLPLWWKFLQTLRQSYDANKRWPYYGDSFKYLSAAMVIVYGMMHPEDRRSPWWVLCFVLCTLYQIAWDTFIDWELFVITPRPDGQSPVCESPWCEGISSLRPSSRILLAMQMYILQPISDGVRRISASIPSWEQIKLRPRQLYKNEQFYLKIFIVNTVLRFAWMLCFIPAYRLTSRTGEEKVTTFSSDVNSYIGVLLPIAEIIRRCCWGFLKLEVETLRIMDDDFLYSRVEETSEDDLEEKDRSSLKQLLPTWLDIQQRQQHIAATSSSKSRIAEWFQFSDRFLRQLFVAELSLWVVAFAGFGYWSAC